MNTTARGLPDLLRPYNHAEVARAVGVSRDLVNRWAHGKLVPSVQHIPKLAELLRISVEDLTLLIARDHAEVSRAS